LTEDPQLAIARNLKAGLVGTPQPVRCFVAVGDSFTAGTGCAGGEAWADLVAARLRPRNSRLLYRNLAADGATSAAVCEQLGPALRLEPDLVSLICGGNDVLLAVRPDVEGYADRLASMFERLRAVLPGALVFTATMPEHWQFLPLGPRSTRRVMGGLRALNAATRDVAATHGVPCLDIANHDGLDDPENFAADGLHPSALGHAKAALAVEQLLRNHWAGTTGKTKEA
jgi:lysophospholipase L1-like esterase